MIRLSQITKTYNARKPGAFHALRQIDLEIAPNRITVFRGPSGSGKTTLLSIIGCMSRPTSGRIWLNGRETTGLPERFSARIRRETFGFVFQNYNLIRGLTTLENTMIPACPTGRPHRQVKARAISLLEKLGIGEKAARPVTSLSGGEQQRAAIARALINDPQIIIADEPTAHLDTALARAFMAIAADLKARGKTLLIASHDPLVFDDRAVSRVIALRDGKVTPEAAP
ncbi:ABC transporter ATP-binding protein [Desulfonema ishimotonii]|uniref:ABC transporter ATP-binding protein n=1 Tax=Desulfonema ishimotonii TaxID=45657 RepID=A0A401FY94_9BACT|nr:ABC transporter ATP-binding protein [Desulfonema ishimotonii]GBC61913.1 ABC transporter ATP-binding protein [Desulfonema ishimotonii]